MFSIRGNSSFGKQDKENFETFDLIVNIFPSLDINSISLVSGNFFIISKIIWAFKVVDPESIILQVIVSLMDISISVADNVKVLSPASIKIFDKIGNVFYLLNILCKWESVLNISDLDTINFINQNIKKFLLRIYKSF